MADAGKKKRGKNKSQKTTVSLNEFLADGGSSSPLPPLRSKSWADESAELLDDDLSTQWPDERSHKPQISLSSLPSAPRAATTPNVDITSLPKTPPFTVFLGNLSYDANEDDISKFFEKHKLSVTSVRLVKEKDGRMKGFGYAEFSTRNDLIEALSLTGLNLRNRGLQIDVAEGRNDSSIEGRKPLRHDESDRLAGDWRNAQPDSSRMYRKHSPPNRDFTDKGGRSRRPRQYSDRTREQWRYSPRGDSPPSRRDSPSREQDSPQRYSPTGRRDSSPRRGSPYRRRDLSPHRRGSPSFRQDSSPPRKFSPSRRGPSPTRSGSSAHRRDSLEIDKRDLSPLRRSSNDSPTHTRDILPPHEKDLSSQHTSQSMRYDKAVSPPSPQRQHSPHTDRHSSPSRRNESLGRPRSPVVSYDRSSDSSRSHSTNKGRNYDGNRSHERDRSFGQGWNRGRHQYNNERKRDSDDYNGDRRRWGTNTRGDYKKSSRDHSPFGSRYRGSDDLPNERPKIVLQPRSKPFELSSSEGSSSIFGGAKPVDTAKKEREIEQKLMIKEQKAIEKNERNRLPQDSSMHSSAKEVHIKKRDVDVGDQFNMKQEEGDVNKYEQEKLKQRMSPPLTKSTLTKKEADDEFDRVRKDNTSSIRGRGDRRNIGRSRNDERPNVRGRGREYGERKEKQSFQIRKFEEPEKKEFQQANRFAALMDEDDDGDNDVDINYYSIDKLKI